MSVVEGIMTLVVDQNSGDNNIRRRAELSFNQWVNQDPSQVAHVLIDSSLSDYSVDIVQSCLLHLRRLVPKYWSIGFESFTGTAINQELKALIRQNLVKLVTSTGDSKIRNSASYVIVQIAVADYPDEWSDLLYVLYEHTKDHTNTNAMMGGLQVLNDLFDDLVTEEQFWNGGIGSQLINHLMEILSEPQLSSDVKSSAIALYKSVLNTLQSPEAFNDSTRKQSVYQHIKQSAELNQRLLTDSVNNSTVGINENKYRTAIYSVLSALIGSFNKIISKDLKISILNTLVADFYHLLPIYLSVGNNSDDVPQPFNDSFRELTSLINELLGVLSLIQHSIKIGDLWNDQDYESFIKNIIKVTALNSELIETYEADINEFINDVTGLSGFVNVRDSISELLLELNTLDSQKTFKIMSSIILSNDYSQWTYAESCVYLLESICQNEDSELNIDETALSKLLESICALVRYDNNPNHHPLLTSRVFLCLPKFLEKFETSLNSKVVVNTFLMMIEFVGQIPEENSEYNFVRASCLISCSSYFNLLNLGELLSDDNKKNSIQLSIFKLIMNLLFESEEDALVVLLEALTVSIDIDPAFAAHCSIYDGLTVIDLVLQISFKNPGNVQITVESSNCLTSLLKNLSLDQYINCCEKSLPTILNIINSSLGDNSVEYSPKLDLSLDLLNIIVESVPATNNEKVLPSQIFNYVFPILKKLLLSASDDQLLQSGGAVFNSLLQYGTHCFAEYKDENGESGMNSLLYIVHKFLSPELSDRAALNSGNIVTSLVNKFQQQLGDEFLSQILKATAERLVIAKEIVTIENLIMLFCNLVLLSPESMIDFLSSNVVLKDPKSGENKPGLDLILPIWFQSFEVTRGYEKIKQNALALAKIYSLGDKRIESLIVNGDIIPYDGNKILTRSMTKSMPEKYTRISASMKIIKLLVGELDFQCQQPNEKDFLPEETVDDDEDDEGGWEDLEDIGVPNYEKLKSYVEDEEEQESPLDDGLKSLLVQFFKECVSKNLGGFQAFYDQLSDDEKRILTENVFF
ncbi:importin subunit beta-5 [[Candida] jaroonii]|uniref:Importin subunit beta-5 n=1 Tax=[Candida] jaroonii TaxID=467808 RepID=A0ACA9Y1X9_9ASCO|nr:importin subunit beta-5 [[Candida] jaroonii]